MPKKPRMPKNVQQSQPDTPENIAQTDDEFAADAIISDAPAPVTKITRRKDRQGAPKHEAPEPDPELTPPPAPRSKMREKLLANATPATKRTKAPRGKKIASDIWDRADLATSFENDPEPARQFSGRTVALLTVLFIAAIIMAQPLQLLLEQQNDITQAQQRLSQEQQRQENLETQLERWEDPAYVQQQARERFNMVMPGEKKYLVIDDQTARDAEQPNVAPLDEELEMGWADRLWGSVITSGQE